MSNPQPKNNRETLNTLKRVIAGVFLVGASTLFMIMSKYSAPKTELHTKSLTIGIINYSPKYEPLISYIKKQFGANVEIIIDGNKSLEFSEVKKRIIAKKWDIAFTYSPMLSVLAKDNDYIFAARMFPKYPPYYRTAIFVKQDSKIQGMKDLNPNTTIALGDFNYAATFYMPVYDLYGKTLQVDMKHSNKEIIDMVETGKADVGVGTTNTVQKNSNLRTIYISKVIPGSGVYLSPNLSESDRTIISNVLLNAPADIQEKANYGADREVNYEQFKIIMSKAEKVLQCADFNRNPINFFCNDSHQEKPPNYSELKADKDIVGIINGWYRIDNTTDLWTIQGQNNNIYNAVISSRILNKVVGYTTPFTLSGKAVKITGVTPQLLPNNILEVKVTQAEQVTINADKN